MTELQDIVQFLRKCYQSDQRENNIWDIFHEKVEAQLFFEGEEKLLTATLPHQYLPEENARAIRKVLELYRKEKALYYFSFFVVGRMSNNAEETNHKKICAPLLYYPAEILEEDETFYVRLDFSKQFINYPLISALDNIAEESYEQALFEALPETEIGFPEYEAMLAALKPYLSEVDFTESYHYPEDLYSEEALRQARKSNVLQFIPASCLGVLTQSKQTRGVLNELAQIARQEHFSRPLQQLFSLPSANPKPIEYSHKFAKYVPANLSNAQNAAIQAAKEETLSVIVGPPGTGKSFTIAALAAELMNEGKSVLIASKTDTAVDVIAHKIEHQLGLKGCMVRGGRKDYLSALKNYLKDILAGVGIPDSALYEARKLSINELEKQLMRQQKTQKKAQKQQQKMLTYLRKSSQYLQENTPRSFLGAWWAKWRKRQIEKKWQKYGQLWQLSDKLQEQENYRKRLLQELVPIKYQNNIRQALKQNRQDFRLFSQAIRSRRDAKQEELFRQIDFSVIFQTFPIWLCNLNDIYDILPLSREIFDVAIIDEASQCDIASCLPIFQRAKRVVIVGDPKQLRHISFLSRAKQAKYRQDFNITLPIDYREESILDLVQEHLSGQQQINFLNEHFRSYPPIIQFSNQQFYQNALRLMQPNDNEAALQSLELVLLESERQEAGYNEGEAQFILKALADIPKIAPDAQSVGILSPFRSQVDYIAKLLQKHIAVEIIQKYQLEVGTAHSFQGNEKDLMFISLVVDNRSKGGSFNHLNKADLFNVSISRAAQKQFILLSAKPESISTNSLLGNYLKYLQSDFSQLSIPKEQAVASLISKGKTSTEEIKQALETLGYKCQLDYTIAGTIIELLIEKNKQKLGIDIFGADSKNRDFDLDKTALLKRSGIDFTYISFLDWYFAPELCIKTICQRLP